MPKASPDEKIWPGRLSGETILQSEDYAIGDTRAAGSLNPCGSRFREAAPAINISSNYKGARGECDLFCSFIWVRKRRRGARGEAPFCPRLEAHKDVGWTRDFHDLPNPFPRFN